MVMDPRPGTDRSNGPPAADPGGQERHQRRVRNFLLDTGLQLRLASYLVAVAVALSGALGGLLWQAYRETSRVVALSDPDVGDSIGLALAEEDRWRMVLIAAALLGVLVCLLVAAVVMTHRIAGPAFAIGRACRQVAEGRLTRPRPLRTGDHLVGLAAEVGAMVEALREREARERDALREAAAALRTAGGAGARSPVESLERLAHDKDERLRD
jgi:HAMP domain-containing protein